MEEELLEISKAAKIIGSKWTLLILNSLLKGTKRFGQLQREIENINPRTLSKRLSDLEKEGYILKKIYAQVPSKVEYSLTPKAQVFKQVVKAVKDCGEKL
ncbi:MAG: helix-turn-helix transcriptional regulator [Candidatus Levybacteria bacterium]|nr:helix-turn-helix transcriptional regulator [Candidatus Levybacteria bacterium]